MNIDELIAEATAKPGERVEMEIGLRVFCAVFHMRKAAVYMDGKRVPLGVAKQGLLLEERRTGEKAVLCQGVKVRTLDDLIYNARIAGRYEVVLAGVTFGAVHGDGYMHLLHNGERMTRKRIEPIFEYRMRVETIMRVSK